MCFLMRSKRNLVIDAYKLRSSGTLSDVTVVLIIRQCKWQYKMR